MPWFLVVRVLFVLAVTYATILTRPFGPALEIATRELLLVRPALFIRYNTVLNLWDPPRGARVRQP